MSLGILERQLCDTQGRLFVRALNHGYDSAEFIKAFMNSSTAMHFDYPYDRMQWLGDGYILEELLDETGGLPQSDKLYPTEVMYWTGYVYRYWHYLMNTFSRDIYAIADAETMNKCFLGFHTLDVEMAIENLIMLHEQSTQN